MIGISPIAAAGWMEAELLRGDQLCSARTASADLSLAYIGREIIDTCLVQVRRDKQHTMKPMMGEMITALPPRYSWSQLLKANTELACDVTNTTQQERPLNVCKAVDSVLAMI